MQEGRLNFGQKDQCVFHHGFHRVAFAAPENEMERDKLVRGHHHFDFLVRINTVSHLRASFGSPC